MNLRNVPQIENESSSEDDHYKTSYIFSMAHSNKLKNIFKDISESQAIYDVGLDLCIGFKNKDDGKPQDPRSEFIAALNLLIDKFWNTGRFRSITLTLWFNPEEMDKVRKWVEINHDLLTHPDLKGIIYCALDSNKPLTEQSPADYHQNVNGSLVVIKNIRNTSDTNDQLLKVAKLYQNLLKRDEVTKSDVMERVHADAERFFQNLCTGNLSEAQKEELYKACCQTVENENLAIFIRNAFDDAIEPTKYLLLSTHEKLFSSTNYFQENAKKMNLLGRKCTLIHDQVKINTSAISRSLQLPNTSLRPSNIRNYETIPVPQNAPGTSSFVSSQGKVLSAIASSSQSLSPKKRGHGELNPSYSPPVPSSPKVQRNAASDNRALDALSVISEKVAQVAVTSGKVNDASAILISLFDHYVHGPKNPPRLVSLVSVDPDDHLRPDLSPSNG